MTRKRTEDVQQPVSGAVALLGGSGDSESPSQPAASSSPRDDISGQPRRNGRRRLLTRQRTDRHVVAAPSPAPEVAVRPESANSPLPDLAVRRINCVGGWVNLRNEIPADRPVLVWFWAPH
jgi:hypothetical protein